MDNKEKYIKHWESKTLKQCQKELDSWHKHMDKHSTGYHWSNDNPNDFNDADRVLALKQIIREKSKDV